MTYEESLEHGRRALGEWAWLEARAAFEAALSERESGEALEGLGVAAFWLDDAAAVIGARERAYGLYRDREDPEGAARVAAGIADALLTFRGEPAVAAGWLQRGRSLLAGRLDSPVLSLIDVLDAFISMAYERDVVRAVGLGEAAVARARRLGDVQTEMFARGVLGVVLVSTGRFAEGTRMLDEAAAATLAGDVRDPEAVGNICCALVTASVRMRDFDRLAQWSRHVMDLPSQWSNRTMFSYPRTEYAVALTWWGRWEEAERELLGVVNEMWQRPLLAALAMLRLADLRRRQGRFDEARALLEDLNGRPNGVGFGHLAGAVAAAVAFDRGDPARGVELAERYLRLVPRNDVVERADGLEVLVRARIALRETDRAAQAASELAGATEAVPTRQLRAASRLATGLVAAQQADPEVALSALEEAIDLYEASGAPFETARARVELGRTLLALGQPRAAAEELRSALSAFQALGAARDSETVTAMLETLAVPGRHGRPDVPLTPREVEVLRLIASGRSNEEIAASLVLSVRTVERHVSNIYAKIGAYGRTARAVATTYAHTHALT